MPRWRREPNWSRAAARNSPRRPHPDDGRRRPAVRAPTSAAWPADAITASVDRDGCGNGHSHRRRAAPPPRGCGGAPRARGHPPEGAAADATAAACASAAADGTHRRHVGVASTRQRRGARPPPSPTPLGGGARGALAFPPAPTAADGPRSGGGVTARGATRGGRRDGRARRRGRGGGVLWASSGRRGAAARPPWRRFVGVKRGGVGWRRAAPLDGVGAAVCRRAAPAWRCRGGVRVPRRRCSVLPAAMTAGDTGVAPRERGIRGDGRQLGQRGTWSERRWRSAA